MLFTSGFVDDVMIFHSAANGTESKTAHVLSSSPDGGTGGNIAVYDYKLVIIAK